MRAQCYSPELTAAFAADPWGTAWHFRPPGGESQHDVERRMTQFILGQVLARVTPDAPAVLVGHGMAIKARGVGRGWQGRGVALAGWLVHKRPLLAGACAGTHYRPLLPPPHRSHARSASCAACCSRCPP